MRFEHSRAHARLVRRPGTVVRSHLRAQWKGVVVGPAPEGRPDHCVQVRITHDRHGRPIRKPNAAHNLRTLDPSWLEILS